MTCYQINITRLEIRLCGVSESVGISLHTLLVSEKEREIDNNNIYQISIYTSSFLNSQTRLFFFFIVIAIRVEKKSFFLTQ